MWYQQYEPTNNIEKYKANYDELLGTRMRCVAQIVLQIFRQIQVELFINY